MSDNPYQSPLTVDAALPVETVGDLRRSLLAMLGRGLVMGGMVGSFSGAAAALSVALLGILSNLQDHWDILGVCLGFGILGGICGMFSGGGIGLLLGLVTGMAWFTSTRALATISAVAAAVAGGFFGFPAGILSSQGGDPFPWPLVGAALGVVAGLIGGAQLGRLMARWQFVTHQAPPNP